MSKKTPLGIFSESIGLYFSNFNKFFKYMSFPVLGQIAGLGLVLCTTYFYTQNIPTLVEKHPDLGNFNTLITISILIALPGLAIFLKAFWEYLIAYGAINSMLENMLKSGKVYDFDAHTELIKRRALSFIGIWFLYGFFYTVAILPLFWVICGILTIYFVLVFQVFTFEPDLSPMECIKKSMCLIKGHFASTFMLFTFAGILTYLFIPQIFHKIFEATGFERFLSNLILPLVKQLPLPNLTSFGVSFISPENIANLFIQIMIAQILIQYTLPLRSVMWSLWYKELSKKNSKAENNKTAYPKKRPCEKLMQASHKKYGTKKLSKNILKRATEKQDD